MRRAALGLLAASSLAGCNLVFGLKETSPNPDGPPADVSGTPIHLTLLQFLLDANGAPLAPTEIAMPDLVKVEAKKLDGGSPVSLTSLPDGTIGVPPDITASGDWALIYQRQGGVVREIQNPPEGAHLIETLLGPLARTAPDPASGYVITPASYPGTASHNLNRVLTTGTWTEGTSVLPPAGATLDYDYASASSYSGPPGKPAAGDHGVLADFALANGCRSSTGSTDFDADDIGPPKPILTGSSWVSVSTGFMITTDLQLVLTGDVAPLGETGRAAVEQVGYVPSKDMPAFTRPPEVARSVGLPNPAMFAVRSCPLPYSGLAPSPVLPVWLDTRLPRGAHTEITASRMLPGGASVTNGIGILTINPGTTFTVATDISFATNVRLVTPAAMTDLFDINGADDVPFVPGSDLITLRWDKQMPGTAQFWEVALIEVQNSNLVRKHVYVTTTTSVRIQPSELLAAHHYVFAISAFSGRAGATTGDFRTVTGVQSMSVIHPRSIFVQ